MSSAAAAGEVTGLDVATFVIAVLALLLAALGLGCQILTHFLTGGRVKVELRIGAMAGNGSGMVTAPATNDRRAGWGDELAQQGYTRPVVAVRVRNVGRLPVSVSNWSLVSSPSATELTPMADSIGPPLRHRLEAGESETWEVESHSVFALAEATKGALGLPTVIIRGKVELGDGRTYDTQERIRF